MKCSLAVFAVLGVTMPAVGAGCNGRAVSSPTVSAVAQRWEIHGQVVDEQGAAADDFDVATFWSSNGARWDENGQWTKVRLADAGKLLGHEGVLAAHPKNVGELLPGGKFSIDVDDRPTVSLFAVDRAHRRGGVVIVNRNDQQPVSITLLPLVRVTGTVRCPEADRTPDRTVVMVRPAGADGRLLFTECGSVQGAFSFLLPPGIYDFDVYSESPDAWMHAVKQNDASADTPRDLDALRVDVPRTTTLDLGQLNVELHRDQDGIARDYSQFYGKKPPDLDITDARGVPKQIKLADFRGKWLLVDFWALWCGPCIKRSLPELVKFYEQHAADRDRFEILAICNTDKEHAKTIREYDRLAAPTVENLWGGKSLPFPVLIDGEGKTWRTYGIGAFPTLLLIDPDGNIVKFGDLEMLAEKLKVRTP